MTNGVEGGNAAEANGGADAAENARWAALAAELGDEGDEGADEGQQPADGAQGAQGEGDGGADAGAEGEGGEQQQRGPVAYEEHQNVQKALRAARESERRVTEQLNGVTALINSLRTQRQQPQEQQREEPKLPTIEEDPIGHFTGQLAQMQRTIDELRTGNTQTQQQFEQSQQQQAFVNTVAQSEVAIRATTPDYDAACQHLEAGRVAELEAIYGDDNPQAIAMAQHYGLPSVAHLRAAILNQDRITVAQQAIMLGQSPAQLYYNLAKQRGYKPAAPGGQQKTPAQQQLDATRRGQKAAKSIGGGTGGGPDNGLSIADLTELYASDPEAFDREWDKMARAGKLG